MILLIYFATVLALFYFMRSAYPFKLSIIVALLWPLLFAWWVILFIVNVIEFARMQKK